MSVVTTTPSAATQAAVAQVQPPVSVRNPSTRLSTTSAVSHHHHQQQQQQRCELGNFQITAQLVTFLLSIAFLPCEAAMLARSRRS